MFLNLSCCFSVWNSFFFLRNSYYRIRSAYLTKNKLLLRNYFLFVVYSTTCLLDILHRWWTNEYEYRTTADRGRSKYSEWNRPQWPFLHHTSYYTNQKHSRFVFRTKQNFVFVMCVSLSHRIFSKIEIIRQKTSLYWERGEYKYANSKVK